MLQRCLLALLCTFSLPAAKRLPDMPAWFEEQPGGRSFEARGSAPRMQLAAGKLSLGGVEAALIGARRDARPEGLDPLAVQANYFTSAGARTARLFSRVIYREIYPGIDLVFYRADQGLEFDFVARPGADPSRIRLRLPNGARLERSGDLVMTGKSGAVRWRRPVLYQDPDHAAVDGAFRLDGQTLSFRVGRYDRSRTLVLDPAIEYASFFGAGGNDIPRAAATDASGNVYVTGLTNSQDLPVTMGAAQTSFGGQTGNVIAGDVFVAKFNPQGRIVYVTYAGGTGDEHSTGIAVDATGAAYVVGTTLSRDFPTTAGVIQRTYGGNILDQIIPGGDGFVFKLNPAGSQVVFSTLLGSNSDDEIQAVALDSAGNIVVAGHTSSLRFPTTQGAFQTEMKGFGGQAILPRFGQAFLVRGDAFVTKLNPDATRIVYSTMLGGARDEYLRALVLDRDGNAIIAGSTLSEDFPTTAGALRRTNGGFEANNNFFHHGDGFIAKLNVDGTRLIFGTYLGAAGDEGVEAMALDPSGDIWVTGPTTSRNFPLTAGVHQTANRGPLFPDDDLDHAFGDAFITRLAADGSRVVASTLFGGSGDEIPLAIAVDPAGNVVVGGMTTSSTAFPATADAPQRTFGGKARALPQQDVGDGFVAQLRPDLTSVLWATYTGGSEDDTVSALAFDRGGNLWAIGQTNSANFPVRAPAQARFGGATTSRFVRGDGFLARYSGFSAAPPPPLLTLRSVVHAASNVAGVVSPGMIFVAYSTNAGPAQLALGAVNAATGRLATTVAETRILFDGVPAPMVYASAGQSSGIVPYGVAGRQSTSVVVEYRGQRSEPLALRVAATAPGLFSVDFSGTGQGAIFNQDNSPNSRTSPAAKGSIVVLYGTGEGVTSPPSIDGQLAAEVFPKPAAPVSVTVGGRPVVDILYAGAVPGQVAGLFQMNIRLPDGLATGSHPVVVTVGGVASVAGLTVAVE